MNAHTKTWEWKKKWRFYKTTAAVKRIKTRPKTQPKAQSKRVSDYKREIGIVNKAQDIKLIKIPDMSPCAITNKANSTVWPSPKSVIYRYVVILWQKFCLTYQQTLYKFFWLIWHRQNPTVTGLLKNVKG